MAIVRELPVLPIIREDSSALWESVELARPMGPAEAAQVVATRKPSWLKAQLPSGEAYQKIKSLLAEHKLHTVCEEARCPNLGECWATGTATFMLGTEVCTRACRFCAIRTARRPPSLDPKEPEKIALAVEALHLKYVVLTAVDRDDLTDGGAAHFAETIRAIKVRTPEVMVEALVPDFRGNPDDVETLVLSGVDVYAHNVETVKRLQYRVRDPRAGYEQSLGTLRYAKTFAERKNLALYTKSSLMVGLGEQKDELIQAFNDLRQFDVDVLTLGQYLRPTAKHLPVERFYEPSEFDRLKEEALKRGFHYVAAGPLVRSSYKAAELFLKEARAKERQNQNGF